MIEINHLTKKYGDHIAVDDLNLTVEPGKIYGFLGPNGAGKSTTMNIITGYIGATEGSVKICGHDIFEEPEEAKRCIGYLPELPPLYMDMTIEEYLSFAAQLKGIAKENVAEAVETAMERTQVSGFRNRLIKNLSKGYKQRVGLAQAIINLPEIIILDEPTVGLDPKQIIEIRDLIRELGKDHTVILSSHILSEVSEVCDHVFIISQGKLVASDSPENLSGQLQGGMILKLQVKGEASELQSVLMDVENVKRVDLSGEAQDDVTEAVIEVAKGVDIREDLFFRLAERHLPIMGLSIDQATLEDVFLTLTGEEEKVHNVSDL